MEHTTAVEMLTAITLQETIHVNALLDLKAMVSIVQVIVIDRRIILGA